jgi:phosphohistidine phosphatase SixA
MPLLLVRHAWAGHRHEWEGPDRERPLDERGRAQARDLVALLEPYRILEIHTSPARRCVETVEPLAAARGLEPLLRAELGEKRRGTEGVALVRELAGRDVLVCGHGGHESALHHPPKFKKGEVLVVDDELRVVDAFRA